MRVISNLHSNWVAGAAYSQGVDMVSGMLLGVIGQGNVHDKTFFSIPGVQSEVQRER